MLHTQVVWDHPTNDQDLHVTHLSANGGNDSFFSTQYDCYWQEKKPVWFSTHPSGEGPNPRLDVDDRDGSGPENVNIDRPNPGIYRTFVHYFPESGWDFNSGASDPTIQTVKIYLAGILAFSKQRTLTQEKQVWAVADVTWYAGATEEDPGYGTVTQFPASRDNPSEIGQIEIMDNTASECRTVMGCDFPEN